MLLLTQQPYQRRLSLNRFWCNVYSTFQILCEAWHAFCSASPSTLAPAPAVGERLDRSECNWLRPERHRKDGEEESVRPTIGHNHRHGGDSVQTAVVTIVYAFVEKRFVPSPAGPIPARSAMARSSRWIFKNGSASARVSGAATQSDSEVQTQCMKGKTMTPRELFDSVGRSGIRKMHPGTRWKPRPGERVDGRRIGVPGWDQDG